MEALIRKGWGKRTSDEVPSLIYRLKGNGRPPGDLLGAQLFLGKQIRSDNSMRGFEQSELEFFGAGERDWIAFGKAGGTVMVRLTRSSLQHTVQTQIGQAVGCNIFAGLFFAMRGRNQLLFRRCIDAIKARVSHWR